MEEKAMRLPAALVFPLVPFILPTLFIVLIGPAFLRMTAVFVAFPI
jgi:tight adherence protein C